MSGGGGFGAVDWLVMGLYLAFVVLVGVAVSRRKGTAEDYLLGGRRMPTWAVSVSILATSLSAVTFIGGPQDAYVGDLTYLSLNIGALLAAVLVAVVFIPVYYRLRVTTVYELLGARFGVGAQRAGSAMFMVGRVMASGARLYVAAIPCSLVVFGDLAPGHLMGSIGLVAVVAIGYTFVGGIRAVIWTDVAQVVVLLGAAVLAIGLLLNRIPMGIGEIVETLRGAQTEGGGSKLRLINRSGDVSSAYTIWSAVIGFTLLNAAAYGTDQDLVQRMLTCRSAVRGAWSVIVANLMGVVVVGVFLSLGLLLWVHYEVEGGVAPSDTRGVFLRFVLEGMPPGLAGLMMAGLFAAAMSSLDSALNAMASTVVSDFYRPLRPALEDAHYVRVSRLAVVGWGVVLAGFACVSVLVQHGSDEGLIRYALGIMVYAYAGLLGVFLTALLTRRGSTGSVIAALVVGFVVVAGLQFGPSWLNGMMESGDGMRVPAISIGWRMTAGTVAAFLVCVSVSGRRCAD